MKKVVIVLLLSLFVITTVFATQSRMSGLGNPYGLIEDDTDVFMFPARIFDYSGVVVGELDQSDGSSNWTMSANIPILEYKLGVYLNRDTNVNDTVMGYGFFEEMIYDMDISKSVEFNFGFRDKFAVGFGTSADYDVTEEYITEDNEIKKVDPAANYYALFGGYSENNIDVGVRLVIANAEGLFINGEEEYYDMNKTAFSINARKIMKPAYNLDLIVKAGFAMDITEYDYDYVSTKETNDSVDLAFSLQMKANENNKIIFGVTPFIYNPISFEATNDSDSGSNTWNEDRTYIYFPIYNLAVESKITSWLTGRFGANQSYSHVNFSWDASNDGENADDNEFEFYDKNYYMNLGLSFNFGKFYVDSVLEQELLFDGPNFLGGKSNGLASEISVKYSF